MNLLKKIGLYTFAIGTLSMVPMANNARGQEKKPKFKDYTNYGNRINLTYTITNPFDADSVFRQAMDILPDYIIINGSAEINGVVNTKIVSNLDTLNFVGCYGLHNFIEYITDDKNNGTDQIYPRKYMKQHRKTYGFADLPGFRIVRNINANDLTIPSVVNVYVFRTESENLNSKTYIESQTKSINDEFAKLDSISDLNIKLNIVSNNVFEPAKNRKNMSLAYNSKTR